MPFVSEKRSCGRCCDVYTCPHCPHNTFETASALIEHLRKSFKHKRQESNTTFWCSKCNVNFQSKRGYIHHLQQKRIHIYDLHQAACCGRFQDVAKFIRNQQANETGASHIVKPGGLLYQRGMTPMHCAAFRGYSRCLRIMLSWEDGDPNIQDEVGQTPVHLAARCGKASTLRLLLNRGGRLDLKDEEGNTPGDLADIGQCSLVILRHDLELLISKMIRRKFLITEEEESQNTGNDEQRITEIAGDFSEDKTESSTSKQVSVTSENLTIRPSSSSQSCIDEGASAVVENTLNVIAEKEFGNQIREASSAILPCEVIARGDKAISAFKTAFEEGTSSASRLQVIVVGDIRAGKTSLIRSLSGQPFDAKREKTHGIQTTSVVESIVKNTEMDVQLWKLADSDESHLDKLIAQVVSDKLKQMSEITSKKVPELPPSPGEFNEKQIMKSMAAATSSLSTPVKQEVGSQVLITEPSIPVEGSPRKLPASLVAKNLLDERTKRVSVRVNIWDFAGHQLYEPMHHLFMNNRSWYLVVFNLNKMLKSPRKSLCRIHFWMNSIASHTEATTPIILVGTHKAKVTPDFINDANRLCKKHFVPTFGPRLVRGFNDEIVFAVENSLSEEDEGITNLRNVIKNDASTSFSFVNQPFPIQWLHCEEFIIKYRQDKNNKMCIKLNEFKELLESECMVKFTEDTFTSMASFFHDSGLILLPSNMCGVEDDCAVSNYVILSPQYLVDLMTSIHDVPKDRNFQRQFSDEHRKLESDGRINRHVLEYIWKEQEVNAEILVELMSYFNILYPVSVEAEEGNSTEYVIPCMIKDKSNERCEKRWQKVCKGWKCGTVKERQFVFDFGRFLPPALFHYLLVHIYSYSRKTNGINPIMKRCSAIFSISDHFLFRLQLALKDCQIWVYARCGPEKNFLDLAKILKGKVSDICQQYFKYLKFIFGPPCPREDCPGATFHVEKIQQACESSSSEGEGSSDSSEDTECSEAGPNEDVVGSTTVDENERRCHVIPMNLDSFEGPYWCREINVSEDLKDWDPASTAAEEDVTQLSQDDEKAHTLSFEKECVQECCVDSVAEKLGDDWKAVSRKLKLQETEIQNICADSSGQKEHGFQALLTWKKSRGVNALVGELNDVLTQLQLTDVAEHLKAHCSESHGH